jgi:hypothetical protein
MSIHYDTNLKNILPANSCNSDIVLNRYFTDWEAHIADNLGYRNPSGGSRYESGRDSALLDLCREHAPNKRESYYGDKIIMITHPFYMHLTHMDELDTDSVKSDAEEYLDKLLGLLQMRTDNSEVSVVALETIHHYAAATSLLVENGLIDRVIFTEYDSGYPLIPEELADFKDNTIFFCGAYNGSCLYSSIRTMEDHISTGQIWAIRDLVLNSPQDYSSTLHPKRVVGVDKSRVVNLEKALQMLHWAPCNEKSNFINHILNLFTQYQNI